MPKIVDHAERRRNIIEATWQVIARGGLANTTTREIAKEAKCSTGVLAHYFADRADILASALVTAHQGVRVRIEQSVGDTRGLDALRLFMLEVLPLDEKSSLEARIEACFWGEAVGNHHLMKIQNDEVDSFCDRVRTLLVQAAEDDQLLPTVDIDQTVHECLILMDGMSIQSVMYPERNHPKELIAILDELLARLRS